MTKTLREEINLLFIDIVHEYDGAQLTSDEVLDYTDKTLQLIEKRIDELIAPMEQPTTIDNALNNLVPLAWNNALNALKKEMLK